MALFVRIGQVPIVFDSLSNRIDRSVSLLVRAPSLSSVPARRGCMLMQPFQPDGYEYDAMLTTSAHWKPSIQAHTTRRAIMVGTTPVVSKKASSKAPAAGAGTDEKTLQVWGSLAL